MQTSQQPHAETFLFSTVGSRAQRMWNDAVRLCFRSKSCPGLLVRLYRLPIFPLQTSRKIWDQGFIIYLSNSLQGFLLKKFSVSRETLSLIFSPAGSVVTWRSSKNFARWQMNILSQFTAYMNLSNV